MCFSASASFAAGGFLLGLGVITLKVARQPTEKPFAAIPLLFAVQQLSEGVIWWTFSHDAPLLNTVMSYVYSFFSHVLWPVYVPLAVLLIEPPGWRKKTLWGVVTIGIAVASYLLYVMVMYSVVSRPIGQHIEYVSPHFFAALTMTLYLIATTASLLMSSHTRIRIFGAVSILAFVAAYIFYAKWFISVWCFFAAVLSVLVYFYFESQGERSWQSRLKKM
ncbi:MAG: hypothetical protein KJ852_12205 [Gammaproteobacteria bacterium]|nr:hypothetical protein [Gammaproteobacteria bacterium]MBU0786558.1 hypothetical protein [Gammaproteobacteria bacterium]MBU0817166.1 hypothetical protein [Gammaproteobacteria bacterium]MBU1787713.1 hypothetical protein [Gammaproteobacteria bacterium]